MQLNNSINNAQPSFNARLYLQNINKKDLDFFKGIAKDFHIGTTAIKGKSYTLTDIGDKLVLTSNPNKRNFGSIYKKDMNTIIKKQGREGFLNHLKTMAHAIKAFDTEKYTVKIIDESIMKKISTTSSTCEILAVAKKKEYNINDFIKKNKLILLDSISDPGNLGTIIRSASAFGIDGIILYKDCVDMYSSKVIRSAAGNFFKIPIIIIKNTEEIKNNFKDFNKIATALYEKNTNSIEECKNIKKYIIMFGSEANGLSNELINIADKNIILKMNNNVESLNLSVSASIIMYNLLIN